MLNTHDKSSSAVKWTTASRLFCSLFLATVLLTFAACSGDELNSIKIIAHVPPGTGSGNVSSLHAHADINCDIDVGVVSGQCFDDFNDLDGDPVLELRATPKVGSNFVMWGGCPSVAGNLCSIAVGTDVHTEVSALFELDTEASPR